MNGTLKMAIVSVYLIAITSGKHRVLTIHVK